MDGLLHRLPALEEAEIRQMVNGAESFTPDGHPILGEAPEVIYFHIKLIQQPISDCKSILYVYFNSTIVIVLTLCR